MKYTQIILYTKTHNQYRIPYLSRGNNTIFRSSIEENTVYHLNWQVKGREAITQWEAARFFPLQQQWSFLRSYCRHLPHNPLREMME